MLELHKTAKFVRDYKRMQRRGYDMQLLKMPLTHYAHPSSCQSATAIMR